MGTHLKFLPTYRLGILTDLFYSRLLGIGKPTACSRAGNDNKDKCLIYEAIKFRKLRLPFTIFCCSILFRRNDVHKMSTFCETEKL